MSRTKLNVTKSNAREYLPPHVNLLIKHYHPGNSTPTIRRLLSESVGRGRPPEYVTVAKVVDRATKETLSVGYAACSPTKDVPRRSIGHHVAAGRAVSKFLSQSQSGTETPVTGS